MFSFASHLTQFLTHIFLSDEFNKLHFLCRFFGATKRNFVLLLLNLLKLYWWLAHVLTQGISTVNTYKTYSSWFHALCWNLLQWWSAAVQLQQDEMRLWSGNHCSHRVCVCVQHHVFISHSEARKWKKSVMTHITESKWSWVSSRPTWLESGAFVSNVWFSRIRKERFQETNWSSDQDKWIWQSWILWTCCIKTRIFTNSYHMISEGNYRCLHNVQ